MLEYFGIVTFIFFLLISLIVTSERKGIKSRDINDWVVDISSLLIHFFILPILQILIVQKSMAYFFPNAKVTVESTLLISILFYLIIDYGWYWNHRILHSRTKLWNLPRTHHSPTQVDVFTTARS